MVKKRAMPEEVKQRLRERAARRVPARRQEAVDWHAACDRCLDVHEQRMPEVIARMKAKDSRLVVRAPSRLPALATEILKARLPHVPCLLSSWIGYRETVVFAWDHLETVFEFLGILRLNRRREPSYVTRPIRWPRDFVVTVVNPLES